MSRLWLSLCLVLILLAIPYPVRQASAPPAHEVEVFDVKKGSVVRKLEPTDAIRREAERILASISGQAPLFRADPEDGRIIRIPLAPPVEVTIPGFHALTTEMFVFIPESKQPYVLLFSEENDPRLFAFSHPVQRLQELCLK